MCDTKISMEMLCKRICLSNMFLIKYGKKASQQPSSKNPRSSETVQILQWEEYTAEGCLDSLENWHILEIL